MIDLKVDVAPFDRYTLEVDRRLDGELFAGANDLAEQAEADARALLTVQVYDAPISKSGYERTRKLLDSVRGYAAKTDKGFEVGVEAEGGTGGKRYASYNELGTRGSRVDQNVILADARALAEPLTLKTYSRRGGLEPRPFVTPAIAEAETMLEGVVLGAIDRAAV